MLPAIIATFWWRTGISAWNWRRSTPLCGNLLKRRRRDLQQAPPGRSRRKRMLEYEYFKFVDSLPAEDKVRHKAICRIRIKDREGRYRVLDNSTQILKTSPNGKIWLILCCYDLSPIQEFQTDINAHIKNNHTGEITSLSFSDKKNHILTAREKEILLLIKEGKPSKQIADTLSISIHTVNRHRQNILEKIKHRQLYGSNNGSHSHGLLIGAHLINCPQKVRKKLLGTSNHRLSLVSRYSCVPSITFTSTCFPPEKFQTSESPTYWTGVVYRYEIVFGL